MQELVLGHMDLVELIARRKSRPWLSYDDLISAGHLGLVRAASDFRPRGVPFKHYAIFRILGAMADLERERRFFKKRGPMARVISLDNYLDGRPEGDRCFESYDSPGGEFFDKVGAALDDQGKHIIRWYYQDGVSCQEIGRRLGFGESRVSQILGDCRSRIKEQFSYEDLYREIA